MFQADSASGAAAIEISTAGGPRGSDSRLAFQLAGPASDLHAFLGTLLLFFRHAPSCCSCSCDCHSRWTSWSPCVGHKPVCQPSQPAQSWQAVAESTHAQAGGRSATRAARL